MGTMMRGDFMNKRILFALLTMMLVLNACSQKEKTIDSNKEVKTEKDSKNKKQKENVKSKEEVEEVLIDKVEEIVEGKIEKEMVPKVVEEVFKKEVKKDPETPKAPPTNNNLEPTYVNGILIVNKKYPLPETFNPGEDVVAKEALTRLLNEAQSNGLDISDYYSGFRTYSLQKELYENYKANYGQEQADTFSARPGHSEHQTGLTFDLFHNDGAFLERTAEAEWLANNAHRFGFIVRYQNGKEGITGYQAEPWHLRYIGDEAQAIYESGLSLEEYLNVEGGDYIEK